MPTAARAIRLAFGFVGRYSGTTGLCGEIDAMRCDAMQCVKIKVRTVSCRATPQRTRQRTNFDYRVAVAANHGDQSPPPAHTQAAAEGSRASFANP